MIRKVQEAFGCYAIGSLHQSHHPPSALILFCHAMQKAHLPASRSSSDILARFCKAQKGWCNLNRRLLQPCSHESHGFSVMALTARWLPVESKPSRSSRKFMSDRNDSNDSNDPSDPTSIQAHRTDWSDWVSQTSPKPPGALHSATLDELDLWPPEFPGMNFLRIKPPDPRRRRSRWSRWSRAKCQQVFCNLVRLT